MHAPPWPSHRGSSRTNTQASRVWPLSAVPLGHSIHVSELRLLHYWLRSVLATRPGALRDLVEEQLRKFPGAAFTPHQIGKVLERSAGAADHGRAMIAGPIAPVIPASALAAVGWEGRPTAPRSVPGERLPSGP